MRRVLAAAAATLLVAACGSSDDVGRYDAHVAEVRQAVEAGDRDAALASLDDVGESAFHGHAAGDVSDDELAELAELLDHARAQIDAALPAPTTTAAPVTIPPPAPSAEPTDHGDDDDERGRGNGRGRGGDDGGDDDDD